MRPRAHDLARFPDDRIVPAVMPDEDWRSGRALRREDALAAGDAVGHGLFDQRRHAAFDAGDSALRVKLVGRGDDDAGEAGGREKRIHRGDALEAFARRGLARGRQRIEHA
jgi:hypothetical protein